MAAWIMMAASPSSCPSKIDVFINFRGKDTRKIFIGHLYEALKKKAIGAFYDRFLEKGTTISELLSLIDNSRLSIVVISENYADSPWCLRELVRILKCKDNQGQMVVPIFFEVDPSDILDPKGKFATAFEKHDRDPEIDKEEVESWKSALQQVSEIAGWISRKYEDDSELIKHVANDISGKLNPISSSKDDGSVGMDYHIREMKSLLRLEVYDVRCVAICGTGGKCISVIARTTFEVIRGEFEGCCFLENVKRDFKQLGAACMQEKLLNKVFGDCNTGPNMMKMERLGGHRVLLVLDDVESCAQIEALLGKQCLFGIGSRIIITTRDIQSLSGVDAVITNLRNESLYKYCPKVLSDEETHELFLQIAFGTKQQTRGFINLIRRAIEYVRSLPLAPTVLGTFLFFIAKFL